MTSFLLIGWVVAILAMGVLLAWIEREESERED